MYNEQVLDQIKTTSYDMEGLALYHTRDPYWIRSWLDYNFSWLAYRFDNDYPYRHGDYGYTNTAIYPNVDNNSSNCFSFEKFIDKMKVRRF